jgi:hypothetical protein
MHDQRRLRSFDERGVAERRHGRESTPRCRRGDVVVGDAGESSECFHIAVWVGHVLFGPFDSTSARTTGCEQDL